MRRFTHKNRLDTHQRHMNPLRSYKSLFYLYTSGFLSNPRIKQTWVIYEKSWRGYSKLIIKRKER